MIKALAKQRVLLTKSESRCFFIARNYHRKKLWREITALNQIVWPVNLSGLSWSDYPIRFVAQLLVLLATIPLIVTWQLLKLTGKLLYFPFRYAETFFIPRDLAAPGERTIAGIHNAFNRYFDLPPDDYICCIDDWIRELYGEELAKAYSLRRYFDKELSRFKSVHEGIREQFSNSFRRHIAIARERLSRDLGNYSMP